VLGIPSARALILIDMHPAMIEYNEKRGKSLQLFEAMIKTIGVIGL